jgi:3-dehydroquinate dehydratase-2
LRIAVFNGPNLNLLGIREPEIYGTVTLDEIEARLEEVGGQLGVTLLFSQFNDEGKMLDAIHNCRGVVAGALVNAAAWTHTSLALRDAFAAVSLPYVEVHLSNIYAREPERRHSWLAPGGDRDRRRLRGRRLRTGPARPRARLGRRSLRRGLTSPQGVRR